jgi:S1-C subfamily serine protease
VTVMPTTDAGGGEEAARKAKGLDALATMRVPRTMPPPPGGVLPTTRRGMFRYRVLPRSVIGLSMMILSFAIGSGFSGVVLYSYYQFKLDQTNSKVNALINTYQGQFNKASQDLSAAAAAAEAQVAQQAKNVQSEQLDSSEVAAIVKEVSPSIYFVHTLDSAGQPSVGTAFVVSSTGKQSLLITSYTTVTAATHSPAPQIYVTQGDASAQTAVTLSTWDPTNDLALLILPSGNQPALKVAPSDPPPSPGDRLFVVSGLGTAGASVAEGTVVDVASAGLELDADIGVAFQGGPVINRAGQVLAIGSRNYSPLGFTGQSPWFVPYVQAACNKILTCPGGTLSQ